LAGGAKEDCVEILIAHLLFSVVGDSKLDDRLGTVVAQAFNGGSICTSELEPSARSHSHPSRQLQYRRIAVA